VLRLIPSGAGAVRFWLPPSVVSADTACVTRLRAGHMGWCVVGVGPLVAVYNKRRRCRILLDRVVLFSKGARVPLRGMSLCRITPACRTRPLLLRAAETAKSRGKSSAACRLASPRVDTDASRCMPTAGAINR
jgi:hypothetical protein